MDRGRTQKTLKLKRVRQAKKPTKRNPAVAQKDHFKCIWPAKKQQLNLNYKNNKRIGKPDNWSTEIGRHFG